MFDLFKDIKVLGLTLFRIKYRYYYLLFVILRQSNQFLLTKSLTTKLS